MSRENYPPSGPQQLPDSWDTFKQSMDDAAWELRHLALHGTIEEAQVLFGRLLKLGCDMTVCAETLLTFPGFHDIVLSWQAELTERGVDVLALVKSTDIARQFHKGIRDGTLLDEVARLMCDPEPE